MEKLLSSITSAPSEAWLGLLGVIFGSLLTTFGVWLTNKSNRNQLKIRLEHEERLQRQKISKDRLEELYLLVCHWCSGMFSHYLSLRLVMNGDCDYNQYLDSTIAQKQPENIDFNRLEMIVGIYGGQVQVSYKAALDVRERINDMKAIHKAAYLRGEAGNVFLKPFQELQREFIKATDVLKGEIIKVAKEL